MPRIQIAMRVYMQVDWKAEKFVGLTIKWDYTKRKVSISMPGYIESALLELQHPQPNRPQHCPHPYVKPVYGKTTQMGPDPPLEQSEITDKEHNRIQRVVGKIVPRPFVRNFRRLDLLHAY